MIRFLLALALACGVLSGAAEAQFSTPLLVWKAASSCTPGGAVTLNPSATDALGTLSGGDLTLTSDAGSPASNIISKATASFGANKIYFEYDPTTGTSANLGAGWANAAQTFSGDFLGDSANSFEFLADGEVFFNGSSFGAVDSSAPGTGHVYGIAYDLGHNLLWETHDGVHWNTGLGGTQNPATGSGGLNLAGLAAGPYFPSLSVGGDSVQDVSTVNFGATAFSYAVPSGFSAVQAPCSQTPATAYSLNGPASGTVGQPSSPFTVKSNGNLAAAVTITPNDGGAGGSFSPGTCALSIGNSTSCQFAYTPAIASAITISVANSGTLINPNPITYTVQSVGYTLAGPTGGTVGVATSNFTVASTGTLSAAVVVTPSSGGNGAFSPSTCTLAAGTDTNCPFTFTPSVAGTFSISTSNSGSLPNPSPIVFTASPAGAGFYIAANGSDSNACTLASPCLTVTKCISEMEGSSNKVCYIRAGTYSIPSQITLNDPTDANEMFSFYAPDGYCSAKLDGGSTSDGTGLFEMFEVHTSGVSFIGLQFQNFQQAAVKSVGQNHGGIANAGFLAQYDCATGAHNNGTNGGPFSTWGAQNMRVLNDVIWNTEGDAVDMHNTQTGDSWAGADVENNYIANTNSSNPDMGCIYAWDGSEISPGTFTWKHNLCNNSGSLGNINKGIYLDDRVSGGTVAYNIVVGAGANAFWVHGGINDTLDCNIWDLTNQGQSVSLGGYQDDGSSNMSGQSFQFNIVINFGSYSQPAIDNLLGGDNVPTFSSNIYHNYTGGTLAQGGITDTNPLDEDPLFTATAGNWSYPLQSTSPYAANCSLSEMATAFGYPGFTVPSSTFNGQSITGPSYLQ